MRLMTIDEHRPRGADARGSNFITISLHGKYAPYLLHAHTHPPAHATHMRTGFSGASCGVSLTSSPLTAISLLLSRQHLPCSLQRAVRRGPSRRRCPNITADSEAAEHHKASPRYPPPRTPPKGLAVNWNVYSRPPF
ncbi:hypothetical protein EVAR_64545_1 [Eumeta japonica]|uniref:Uncharacterized protein n=1 Tax=Eumeta variegata TaxID=151549 RepID=A0A4C1ZV35_EUMVA|nr:hypothetical protein EVAR_64545_1 [Eumeta japonica]